MHYGATPEGSACSQSCRNSHVAHHPPEGSGLSATNTIRTLLRCSEPVADHLQASHGSRAHHVWTSGCLTDTRVSYRHQIAPVQACNCYPDDRTALPLIDICERTQVRMPFPMQVHVQASVPNVTSCAPRSMISSKREVQLQEHFNMGACTCRPTCRSLSAPHPAQSQPSACPARKPLWQKGLAAGRGSLFAPGRGWQSWLLYYLTTRTASRRRTCSQIEKRPCMDSEEGTQSHMCCVRCSAQQFNSHGSAPTLPRNS